MKFLYFNQTMETKRKKVQERKKKNENYEIFQKEGTLR